MYVNQISIYIIKQDIRIYVSYSRPKGWTELANIFCGHSWVAGGCYGLKKKTKIIFQQFFFNICFPRATSGPSASYTYRAEIFRKVGSRKSLEDSVSIDFT